MQQSVSALRAVGKELLDARFEGSAGVSSRESDVASTFTSLDSFAAEQKPLFEDALQRHTFREQTHLSAKVHADLARQLQAWGAAQTAYLNTREDIKSRVDAEVTSCCTLLCLSTARC